ncbi:Isoquinoline 1-oxidoreductase subunit alpha [Pirellulimonas nuda]|uniref:Isoquinoline 1-oxidoreductase subunit alpha n=1 Tax=Pirellulimonas nuda TaxID=2528009 RepID=A0A518DDB2_9BACT|nr:(2Fe-2S)-binding protein [Pirellulimonas nuda]QDU89467.1 Isoquinoline 1-oxidoreductase subunit alpha [Pirellulimonas nuda]
MKVTFQLNGELQSVEAEPDRPLLWVLREDLGLTGTKFGCGRALCGACTLHVDDEATRACAFPIKFAEGRRITTIEYLENDPRGKAVIDAWIEKDVVQCGWCQPGQCMSAAALLKEIPNPDDEDINAAMAGNLCRCGTYGRIREAIKVAAAAVGKEVVL